MRNRLARLATFAGTVNRAQEDIGDVADPLQVRRPQQGYMDMSAPGGDRRGKQYDAFRGAVYASVNAIARRVAQLPPMLHQVESRGDDMPPQKFNIHQHPFLSLFTPGFGNRPHEEYSVWEFAYLTSAGLDLTGECWWLVERDSLGTPARVTPLPSNRMTVVFNKQTGLIAGYLYQPMGSLTKDDAIFIKRPESWDELHANPTQPFMVFHRYPSPAGIEDPRGWSPIKAAAYSYDIHLFEMIYKRNFLTQGAQLGGILQSEVALSKTQIEEYLTQFENRHAGVKKAGLPMILPKMLKWTTTEPTPRDLQWVETVGATESQILMIYGISDAKLGRADIGNRGTAEAMDVTFNREVIKSRLDMFSSKLNADFMPIYPGQSEDLYFCTYYDDPVPGDSEMIIRQEKQDIEKGIITRNELRQKRGLDPFGPVGDALWFPANQFPVDAMGAKIEIAQEDHPILLAAEQAQAALDSADEQAKLDSASEESDKKEKKSGSSSSEY